MITSAIKAADLAQRFIQLTTAERRDFLHLAGLAEVMTTESEGTALYYEEFACRLFEITREQLYSRARTEKIAWARFIIFHALHEKGWTMHGIGDRFDKDHGTVSNGITAVKNRMTTDAKFASQMANYIKAIPAIK